MRASPPALYLLFVVASACSTREQPVRRVADTVARSGADSVAKTPADTGVPPEPAVRRLIANPPAPIMPADTVIRGDSAGGPQLPITFPHACQGEDCVDTFRAVACREVQLRVAPSDSSAVVAELVRGDSVEVSRRDIHVLRAGRVIVRRPITIDSYTVEGPEGDEQRPRGDTAHFAAGDTVYLLAYSGMGAWYWWHRGKAESTDFSFAVPDDDYWLGIPEKIDTNSRAIGLSKPLTADWWLVTPRVGGTGWWRNDGSWALRPDAPSFDAPDCRSVTARSVR